MRLLDRYLLRELSIPLAYCLGGFLVFWIAFDIFTTLDTFQAKHLRPADVAEYYLVRTPELLFTVLPVALLLALLYALSNHARHHELVAIRAAGVSAWRLSAPYVGVGIAASVTLFCLNEFWAPGGGEAAERILNRHAQTEVRTDREWKRNVNFHNERDDRFWNIAAYHVPTETMYRPSVTWRDPDGTQRQFFAEMGQRTGGVWTFSKVQLLIHWASRPEIPDRIVTNQLAVVEFTETPAQILSELKVSGLSNVLAVKRLHFSLREIQNYRRLHPSLKGEVFSMINTQLHGRIATPWTCLVVVLIAMPFGMLPGRRNVFVGVAASIFICFAFFILSKYSLALGTKGTIAPWLAAWLPNALFGAAGLVMTARAG
jgi:lipopolysaccharide export system permease protein